MANRLHSGIGENTTIVGESLTEETQQFRPDLNFIANTFTTRFTMIIDISCPYGRISYGENTLQKVYVHMLEKYTRLTREIKADRNMSVEIIPIIVSSLGMVYEQSLKALGRLSICEAKEMIKIERKVSEVVIAGSLEIWRGYTERVMKSEDPQVREVYRQEALMASDE
jgi:hypothetical protein